MPLTDWKLPTSPMHRPIPNASTAVMASPLSTLQPTYQLVVITSVRLIVGCRRPVCMKQSMQNLRLDRRDDPEKSCRMESADGFTAQN